MSTEKVVVIGGGISGLATAALLARNGYKVTLLEKNDFIGGRASYFREKGYFFDKGPSWYMMPEVFDNFFSFFNKKTSDFYELKKLDVSYKVFFEDKTSILIFSDLEKNLETFENLEAGSSVKLRKYLEQSRFIYEKSMTKLVRLDYARFTDIINPQLVYYALKFNYFINLNFYLKRFFKDEKIKKILGFNTVFLGGSPYNTPAFYSLIAHADMNLGIYYPIGGIYKIVEALLSVCQENGVEIYLSEPVIKLSVKDSRIFEVITEKRSFPADVVVSSADYPYFETQVLDPEYQTYDINYWNKKILAPGAYIIYLGVSKKIKNVEHHNLYFGDNWKENFDDIYVRKAWPQNPSYYVNVPSKTDSSVAPAGCETMMFLVPVPSGVEDNDEIREELFEKIISHFENLIGDKILPYIEVKKIFAHRDFIDQYNSFKGTAFGLAHTFFQTALFRPKNKSKKVKNLYYVGQYTNPGIGVPPCLISSEIVLNLVRRYHGR